MNNYQNQSGSITKPLAVASDVSRKFLLNVYNWMTMGLALTGLVAYAVGNSDALIKMFLMNPVLFYGLLILQLVIVIILSAAIMKIPAVVAVGAFFVYSAISGVTFSSIFLVYTKASIFSTFFICAAMFLSVSVLGYITRMNLAGFGAFAFMGLIGIIIASVVNIFLNNSMLETIISYVGVIVFVGLTAWDTQRIKLMSKDADFETDSGKKAAIIGALTLYLDFINMFLMLLRIMGNRR